MINDLPKRITSHAAQNADDFCFWECGSDITLLNQLCQRSLTKVCKWCEDCGFKLSSTKSAAVLFTRKHNPEPISLHLQDSTRLPLKNEHKYLGLTLQLNGSYSTHIQKVVLKYQARLSVIRMLKGTSWGAGKRPLLTVHRSLVRSVIEYGAHPEYSALVDTQTHHRPHSLAVCPSDGICIRCTGFLFAFAQYIWSVCSNLYRRIKTSERAGCGMYIADRSLRYSITINKFSSSITSELFTILHALYLAYSLKI